MKISFAIVIALMAAPAFGQGWSTYRGKQYRVNSAGRICNSPQCQMCNVLQQHYYASIRSQAKPPTAAELEKVIADVEQTLVPMPANHVNVLVNLADPKPGTLWYDLGCGDGRILAAARRQMADVVGLEINPKTAELARKNLRREFSKGWIVHNVDATRADLSTADVVTCYLYPSTLQKMQWQTLKSGAVVISYQHDIPNLKTEPVLLVGCTFYVHRHP